MFSSTSIAAEAEVMRLWRSESDLAVKQKAAIDKAESAARLAGEQLVDEVGIEHVVARASEAIMRAKAEADVMLASIAATRRRRLAALENQIAADRDKACKELDVKESELQRIVEKRDALISKISELECAPMTTVPTDYAPPKSSKLAQEISALQQRIAALQNAKPKTEGFVQADSRSDLLTRIEQRVLVEFVPNVADIERWLDSVEAAVRADRPGLLESHFAPTVIDASNAGTWRANAGVIPGVGREVQYHRTYLLAFAGGAIDHANSCLRFNHTAGYGHGPATYRAGGESAAA